MMIQIVRVTLSALNVVTVKMCLAVLATRQDTQVVVGTTAIQTRMQHGFDYLSDKFNFGYSS